MPNYTNAQIDGLITDRENELLGKAKTVAERRGCRQQAAMEWDMHTGRIPEEDRPKGWKDPYAKLDKAAKAKPKTTKAKTKK